MFYLEGWSFCIQLIILRSIRLREAIMAYPRITQEILTKKHEATQLTRDAFGSAECAINPMLAEALAAQMDLINVLIDSMQHQAGDTENPNNSV